MNEINEIREVLAHYNLGELVAFRKNERGYVNISYEVEMLSKGEKKRYFLRRYREGTEEAEIQFEHTIVDHLVSRKSLPIAQVYATIEEKTYYQRLDLRTGQPLGYYAIFDFLPGEDRYTWVNPQCNGLEIQNSARVLARFHQAMAGFEPAGRRVEPGIIELLQLFDQKLLQFCSCSKQTIFDLTFIENFDLIRGEIGRTLKILREKCSPAMLRLVIHCDYHPGNLKFENGEIVGLFDFDWSKIDYRVFDVALACFYFFTSWEKTKDGEFRLEPFQQFLATYQDTLRGDLGMVGENVSLSTPQNLINNKRDMLSREGRDITPLNDLELDCFPTMLQASNLYVLHWTLSDFYSKQVEVDEYLIYLQHSINFIEWLNCASNQSGLIRALRGVQT